MQGSVFIIQVTPNIAMWETIELSIIAEAEYVETLEERIERGTTSISVMQVLGPDEFPEEWVPESDCLVIATDDPSHPPIQTIYERIRENYAEHPIFVCSSYDDPAFIDSFLEDSYAEYFYLPDEMFPVGLFSVRCKRLVRGES